MNCLKYGMSVLFVLLFIACNRQPKAENTGPEKQSVTTVRQPAQPANTGSPYEPVDVSPMDMSYFPVHYPLEKLAGKMVAPPVMRVIYSRPHLQGRSLFNGILKYNEPWRLGANEATELDVFKAVTLSGRKIAPGRYTLYVIPHEKNWTLVLSSNIDNWGLKQDPTKDLQRIEIAATTGNPRTEYFTMVFKQTGRGADLLMAWDDVLAVAPFVIN
ncbi:MAG: DUF2911 domain-containing protein [Niabella sp.]|nr:DUF2911 domain-containing protein [Niabella sp.]